MDYFDFSIESQRNLIKQNKRYLMVERGVLYINCFIFIFQCYLLWEQPHIFKGMCVGAVAANILWLGAIFLSSKQDLKQEKEKLLHIEKYQEDRNVQGMIVQLKTSQEWYDNFKKSHETN